MKKIGRQAIGVAIVSEEAKLLKSIWDNTPNRANQAEFGEQFEIGNQSAVGQFLRGETALSSKAARGFATGLKCSIADFSPRLAKEAELNAQFVHSIKQAPAPAESQISELGAVVSRLTSSGKMHPAEVDAMIAMLKARENTDKK